MRNVVHDQPVKNVEALANPDALEFFRARPELADLAPRPTVRAKSEQLMSSRQDTLGALPAISGVITPSRSRATMRNAG